MEDTVVGGWKLVQPIHEDLNETKIGGTDFAQNIFQIIPKLQIEKVDVEDVVTEDKNGSSNGQFKLDEPICVDKDVQPTDCTILTLGSGNLVFVMALGSDLLLLDSKLEKVEKKLHFNNAIDFVSSHRSILLVGLCSSEVLIVNSHLEIVESRRMDTIDEVQQIMKRNGGICRYFVHGYTSATKDSKVGSIFTVNVAGKVHFFQSAADGNCTLDVTRLEKTALVETDSMLSPAGVSSWNIDFNNSFPSFVTASYFFGEKYMFASERTRGHIALLEFTKNQEYNMELKYDSKLLDDLSNPDGDIRIQKLVRCEGLLFVLLSTGRLEVLYDDFLFPTTPFTVPHMETFVHDFVAVLSGEEIKLWVLFSRQISYDELYLGIFSGSQFQSELIISVPQSSWYCTINESTSPPECKKYKDMISDAKIRFTQQGLLYEEPTAFTITLPSKHKAMIFQVLESSTEITVQRLIGQGKFDIADALAKKYSVNIDIVRKARVLQYLKDMKSGTKIEAMDRIFTQLKSTLESVEDNAFVCAVSIRDNESPLRKIEWVQQILNIGLERARIVSGSEHAKRLLLTGKKFFTFKQVFPDGSIEDWFEFIRPSTSLFNICNRFLQNGEYDLCNCVWTRHSDEFIEEVDLTKIGAMIWILFSQKLQTQDCIRLFTTILEDALDKCLDSDTSSVNSVPNKQILHQVHQAKLDGMLMLVKRQLCMMEKENSWPHCGLQFVNTLLKIFQAEEERFKNLIANERLQEKKWPEKLLLCQQSSKLLKFFRQALEELAELRTSHTMKIQFVKFIQDDLVEVVNALFNELFSREEIIDFVQKFLKPFAARKGLDLDTLYLKHIESVLLDIPYFATMTSIPYEGRLFCLVDLISSMKIKFTAVYQLVQIWPIPWSSGLDTLVTRILDLKVGLSHGLVGTTISHMNNTHMNNDDDREECLMLLEQIALVKKQVPYQWVLNKYRLTGSKIVQSTGLIMALNRILKSTDTKAYQDCLELLKHTGKFDANFVQMLKFQIESSKLLNELVDCSNRDGNDTVKILSDEEVEERLLALASNMDKPAIIKVQQKALCVLHRTKTVGSACTPEYLNFQNKTAKIMSKKLNSYRALEFLNLQEIIPSLHDQAIFYKPEYPFSAVTQMLHNLHSKSADEVIKECSRLSTITFFPYIELLVAAVIACTNLYESSSSMQKVWSILKHVINISSHIRSSVLQDPLEEIVYILILRNPSTSYENQVILEKFLKILVQSFGTNTPTFSSFLRDHELFMTLRKREIPVENEFLSVYEALHESNKSRTIHEFLSELKSFTEKLIQYGEHDLMIAVFNKVLVHYTTEKALCSKELAGNEVNPFDKIINNVMHLKEQQIEASNSYKEPETNEHILKLVQSLCDIGIIINAFALRNRDKTKLINNLLEMEQFRLASEVALVFDYREKAQWANIIQGFMKDGQIKNLQRLLSTIKNHTELWVLPEFSQAWLQVSKEEPSFKLLCPMPLP